MICRIFYDTASAKKPPTPKNEKGKNIKAKARIIRGSLATVPQSDLLRIKLGLLLADRAPSLL